MQPWPRFKILSQLPNGSRPGPEGHQLGKQSIRPGPPQGKGVVFEGQHRKPEVFVEVTNEGHLSVERSPIQVRLLAEVDDLGFPQRRVEGGIARLGEENARQAEE